MHMAYKNNPLIPFYNWAFCQGMKNGNTILMQSRNSVYFQNFAWNFIKRFQVLKNNRVKIKAEQDKYHDMIIPHTVQG
jgi:phage regulator Rha-like protein